MENPRPEKIAVVVEVRDKLTESDAVLLTDYRGLDVPAMATLRRALREAGGEYKIYKNTLVRFAVQELGLELEDLLLGPTALAFVGRKADGSPGDPGAVAKALRDFAKTNSALEIKGGVLDNKILSADELKALADLPPRDVLLAQLAGAFQAPMAKFAGLLQALPRDFAYGLQALIDKQGGVPESVDEPAASDAVEDSSSEESAEDVNDQAAADAVAEASSDDSAEDVNEQEPTDAVEDVAESDASDVAAEASSDDSAEHVNNQAASDVSEDVNDQAASDGSEDPNEQEAEASATEEEEA